MEDEEDVMVEISFEEPAKPKTGPSILPMLFVDPIQEKINRTNVKGDKREIREIHEIRLEPVDDSVSELKNLAFERPVDMASCLRLSTSLRICSAVCTRIATEMSNPAAQMTREYVVALLVTRLRLMKTLSVPNELIDTTVRFTENLQDKALRMDVQVFFQLLKCCDTLRFQKSMAVTDLMTPSSDIFNNVRRQVFHKDLLKKPFSKLKVEELVTTVNYLESRWNYIAFQPDTLRIVLDCILDRVAVVACNLQHPDVFGNLESYRTRITPEHCEVTETYLEDFCWSLMPMYHKLSFREIFYAKRQELPYKIKNKEAQMLMDVLAKETQEMKNASLQSTYMNVYMNLYLRPSEINRFKRDYRGVALTGPVVIEKMRGTPAKNAIMEKLAVDPYRLVQLKALHRYELDVMYILMMNVRINNTCNKFDWEKEMVFFNWVMLTHVDPISALDTERPYPMLVQAFNGFGVYHHQKFYDHDSAPKAILHWLCIVMSEEYNGKVAKQNFSSLHKYIPDSLKSKAGFGKFV